MIINGICLFPITAEVGRRMSNINQHKVTFSVSWRPPGPESEGPGGFRGPWGAPELREEYFSVMSVSLLRGQHTDNFVRRSSQTSESTQDKCLLEPGSSRQTRFIWKMESFDYLRMWIKKSGEPWSGLEDSVRQRSCRFSPPPVSSSCQKI